jgi:hypothetical protein
MNFFQKNWIAISGAVVGALTLASQTFAVGTYITIPETAVADLTGYAGELFTDLWVIVALVIGIPLAFYIISKVVKLFGHK